jgi:hypothetical protein
MRKWVQGHPPRPSSTAPSSTDIEAKNIAIDTSLTIALCCPVPVLYWMALYCTVRNVRSRSRFQSPLSHGSSKCT